MSYAAEVPKEFLRNAFMRGTLDITLGFAVGGQAALTDAVGLWVKCAIGGADSVAQDDPGHRSITRL